MNIINTIREVDSKSSLTEGQGFLTYSVVKVTCKLVSCTRGKIKKKILSTCNLKKSNAYQKIMHENRRKTSRIVWG